MLDKAWPLIVFTVLAQASVGCFICLQALDIKPTRNLGKYRRHSLFVLFLIMLIALFFSFFHLGSPAKAVHALNNLANSWLSREILAASVFLGILALLMIDAYKSFMQIKFKMAVSCLGVISGIALVFIMSRIYMLPSIGSWDTYHTMSEFFTCSMILGGLLALLVIHPGQVISMKAAEIILILVILFFLIDVINLYFSPFKVVTFPVLSVLQHILSLLGLLVITALMIILVQRKKLRKPLVIIALLCALVSEVFGRILFYAAFQSAGI